MADEQKAGPEDDPKPPAEDVEKPADREAEKPVAEGAEPSAVDEGEKPVRKKKKKRKKEATAEGPNPLGADGRERPVFVLAFPSDPELDRLVKAFELGNYAYVREHGPGLIAKSDNAAVRDAARELVRRIEPDPLIKVLLGVSVTLLLLLTFWAYKTHGN